jgi:hypothetical protein
MEKGVFRRSAFPNKKDHQAKYAFWGLQWEHFCIILTMTFKADVAPESLEAPGTFIGKEMRAWT